MNDATQRAYLEALEIPVWVRKELAESAKVVAPTGLKLGPGKGQVMLVCSRMDEPASRIAADIARSLDAAPVWAWPEPEGNGDGLAGLVAEKLFTSVVIFGQQLAAALLGLDTPETIGSARILVATEFGELARSPEARKQLWRLVASERLGKGGARGAN